MTADEIRDLPTGTVLVSGGNRGLTCWTREEGVFVAWTDGNVTTPEETPADAIEEFRHTSGTMAALIGAGGAMALFGAAVAVAWR